MRKLFFVLILMGLGGCSSFGKGIAEAILDKDKQETNSQCEIEGTKFYGIEQAFKKNETVKILMIHGVGTHKPGYSSRIRDNLAVKLGLNEVSRRAKNITLLDPTNPKKEIGNLRVIRLQNEEHTKDMLFYELTWSNITAKGKKLLALDTSGEYKHDRAAFNHSMKLFLDDTVPDPMVYLLDKDDLILKAAQQSTCWMLGKKWSDLAQNQKSVCQISSYQEIANLEKENITFITHSLGSRIILDTLQEIVTSVGRIDGQVDQKSQQIINTLKEKQMTVFMMANQLPLLQIARPKPLVTNKIPTYCRARGREYQRRVFKKVNIIAFSDPNDLLSFNIPQDFVDNYMDSRMCPEVTNVMLNVADIISAFGVGVVNPVTAHTEYDNDARVIEMIANGTKSYKKNPLLKSKCRLMQINDEF